MRSVVLPAAILAGALLAAPGARAAPPTAAVFPFQLDDTSLQAPTAAERARLGRLDTQLRDALVQSGRYTPEAAPDGPNRQPAWSCDGCELDAARKIGAAVSVTGWVQKVSNLILNINLVVRDVATGQRVAAGSVDIRGDTDESWTRGLAYLLRNRILVAGQQR
ncbi:DUF3280 domain-containing protein [Rhodopila globiformis]|uniref:DUF2380 domain-containing protein n=1 Tax=Rhodopila globiformis TaxID=1071 RepID=A0A2S6NND2_RHOGL|nr:DUF3280 domain-containing protein [Rhodopila globiformis]PPQ38645.1 hypothetical protein CCS01_02015 [Rhodopila globiformis]